MIETRSFTRLPVFFSSMMVSGPDLLFYSLISMKPPDKAEGAEDMKHQRREL